ncbi:unnamed protein product [Rotaria magnacalcarata]|uniref:CN hydrolase domain-containing protein n=2 Tax=Rotaria magnacalcarata TaxID=392030 RepID=A0A820EQU6_9BILA|nr:unnamed protein product [Rotaria magnacalcarata]CAF4250009.1 unnamed protein product [Rotaria magnacalcarata]
MTSDDLLTVGLAQIAPIWFDREKTLKKVAKYISDAADQRCSLVAFGEAIVPGYPFWLELTDGAVFNSSIQKEIHAEYMHQAVSIERGDLSEICSLAKSRQIAVYLGCIERPLDRGGHSLYCSMVFIDRNGNIGSVQRKLMPTYDERLAWSIGDGNGLRVHSLGAFTCGGLNCWENWMPLARSALYAQGEDLHVCIFPGSHRNTYDITPFIAKESRSFVITVSGLMRKEDFPVGLLHRERIVEHAPDLLADGGSCVANPDGTWLIEPTTIGEEALLVTTLDHRRVREERQNFDPSGHYSRPDILKLTVNRERQSVVTFKE